MDVAAESTAHEIATREYSSGGAAAAALPAVSAALQHSWRADVACCVPAAECCSGVEMFGGGVKQCRLVLQYSVAYCSVFTSICTHSRPA
jgi:hypothetical protein